MEGTPRHEGQGNATASGGLGGHSDRNSKGGRSERIASLGYEGQRPFISYVGTHPEDEEPDPDGLNQRTRMQLEDRAIEIIMGFEPQLRRTPAGNRGFDLYELDGNGQTNRWIEVKAMTGNLRSRPVGLSRAQFECARERGAGYWLYVVEHADDANKARVLRIQDPVAHARTFTFDYGWRQIARTDPPA
jgi:hypothetical protein